MSRRSLFKVLLAAALAVSTLAVIGSAAGAQEGRDGSAEPGVAVENPDAGGSGDVIGVGDWDGDGPAPRDQQILDDLIVNGSACVGQDCANGESFGFDTLRLKENNLRLHFQDTSTSASFPTNDWRIVINDSSNGGASYFAVEDSNAGRQVFRVEAGARSNALYVEADGDIGIGTDNPVVDVHIKTGNTPTLRLDQDGSSGFTAQTWDVAGNEANFFIRDATNGSTLPIRLRPGAPNSAVDIAASGRIGFGTASPQARLHASFNNADTGLLITNVGGRARFHLEDSSAGTASIWRVGTANNGRLAFAESNGGAFGSNQLTIDNAGNAYFEGQVFANNQSATPLDEWFLEDIEALQAENKALRAELDALKAVVDALVAAQN